MLELELSHGVEQVGGTSSVRYYESNMTLEDYVELCNRRAVPRSWAFQVRLAIPGFKPFEALAWIGSFSDLVGGCGRQSSGSLPLDSLLR